MMTARNGEQRMHKKSRGIGAATPMPLVVLVTKSLAVSWNGAEVDGDDVPPLGPRGLVLSLPCCLEPLQMSHIES